MLEEQARRHSYLKWRVLAIKIGREPDGTEDVWE
jgi:hypothetical protein